MTTIQFWFSENSDVLSVLVDESGITTDNGWLIKPRCLPLEVKVLSNLMNVDNMFFMQIHKEDIHEPTDSKYSQPANCEMSVRWIRKDEDPQYLEHSLQMKGVNIKELLITLNPLGTGT